MQEGPLATTSLQMGCDIEGLCKIAVSRALIQYKDVILLV